MRWPFQPPSMTRSWGLAQSRTPLIEFHGNLVVIQDFRCSTWSAPETYTPKWRIQVLDLALVESVDLVVEPVFEWRGVAHVLLSFGCSDGETFSISIESRRTHSQGFNPVAGIFRQYELMYVIGEERDVVGMRAAIRKHPVHVYRTRISPENAQFLAGYCFTKANRLANQPEYYHSIRNNCATRLINHLGAATGSNYALDWKILLPGFLDQWALERGLLSTSLTDIEGLRKGALINHRSDWHPTSIGWSKQIRLKGN